MYTVDFGFRAFTHPHPAAALAVLGMPGGVFWPYFAGAVILAVGLPLVLKNEVPPARGLDKLIPFGRLFYALPMAVFGAEHFTSAKIIASIVPSWFPAHLFWVYFVGTALFAAALSLATKRVAPLAATLAGIMFFLFVVLIHIPHVAAHPHDRFFWALALRDTAFSGGALAYAGAHTGEVRTRGLPWMITVGRFFIALPAVFFGVEQILHPTFIPGIPLNKVTLAWVPGRLFWAYLTGSVLLVAGVSLVLKQRARLAAACVGIVIFLVVAFVYLPTLFAHPSDIGNELNYVVDTLMFSGAALLLADALPRQAQPQA